MEFNQTDGSNGGRVFDCFWIGGEFVANGEV